MGFTPAEVDDMSIWQFWACGEGYRKAHNPEELPQPPTEEELEKMVSDYRVMTRH